MPKVHVIKKTGGSAARIGTVYDVYFDGIRVGCIGKTAQSTWTLYEFYPDPKPKDGKYCLFYEQRAIASDESLMAASDRAQRYFERTI